MRIFTLLFATLAFTACTKQSPYVSIPEEPVSKNVEFHVAQEKDHSAPIFDDVEVRVMLSVAKERLSDGSITVLWDTTFTQRNIRQYPSANNPLVIAKTANGILQSKENIRVSKAIRYTNSRNEVSQYTSGEVIENFVSTKRVQVTL